MMNNVEMNKHAKLSEHMTLGELTKTKKIGLAGDCLRALYFN